MREEVPVSAWGGCFALRRVLLLLGLLLLLLQLLLLLLLSDVDIEFGLLSEQLLETLFELGILPLTDVEISKLETATGGRATAAKVGAVAVLFIISEGI